MATGAVGVVKNHVSPFLAEVSVFVRKMLIQYNLPTDTLGAGYLSHPVASIDFGLASFLSKIFKGLKKNYHYSEKILSLC